MSAEVFIYSGEGGFVPQDVVRARIVSSVTSIPTGAFMVRKKLHEVELCEGLVEIGAHSFGYCDHSITRMSIPTSLRRINNSAFSRSLRTPIRLHDGIERIGAYAFSDCVFTNFRVPSLITVIPINMFGIVNQCFPLESPHTSRRLKVLHSTIVNASEMWPFRPMLSSTITSLVKEV